MEENRKVVIAAVGFLVLVAIVILVYYFFLRDTGEGPPVVPETVESSVPADKPDTAGELSESETEPIEAALGESDGIVRELAARLSAHPELAQWLVTDDLIRKFVAAVDNIAGGQSPRAHIDFFKPEGAFRARDREGTETLDPASFERYDVVGTVFESLDAEGSVRLYRRLKSVIQEAYSALGYPDENFDLTLLRAIEELEGVPVREGEITLEKKLLSYEYTDPRLERMSAAQKHLFRMGPANVRRIQAKLREFRNLL